jgi:hypothetical protein
MSLSFRHAVAGHSSRDRVWHFPAHEFQLRNFERVLRCHPLRESSALCRKEIAP